MLTQGRSPTEIQSKDFSTLENESESDLIHSWCSEVFLLLVFQKCIHVHTVLSGSNNKYLLTCTVSQHSANSKLKCYEEGPDGQ